MHLCELVITKFFPFLAKNMESINDSDHLLAKLTEEKVALYLPSTVILIVFVIISIIGNITVLYVYAVKIKTISDDRYFIPYLAAMDMLACVIGVSFGLILNFNPLYFRNDLACRLIWTAIALCILCSGLMLVAIAIQRYIKVCRPFRGQMSIRTKRLFITGILLFSVVSAAPSLYLYGESEFTFVNNGQNVTAYTCGAVSNANKGFLFGYSTFLLLLCIIGISTVCVLYCAILKQVFRQESFRRKHMTTKRLKKNNSSESNLNDRKYSIETTCTQTEKSNDYSNSQSESMDDITDNGGSRRHSLTENSNYAVKMYSKTNRTEKFKPTAKRIFRKHKISIMFSLITAIFVLSFLPRLVLMILEAIVSGFWDDLSDKMYLFCLCLYRLYLLNNVVNPIIYYFFDRVFRKGCKQICR